MTNFGERRLLGSEILILNWRDVHHPQAGGAEQYMYEIAKQWIKHGVCVTWLTARPQGASRTENIDGIRVIRAGGELTIYVRVALWVLLHGRRFAAIIDCQNGIPFFAPLWAGRRPAVVQVIHHVHQDQFATRFSRSMAVLGKFLEGTAARTVYGRRALAVVSPSTREEVRTRLGLRGPAFVVPNGTKPVPEGRAERAPVPTIAVVTRLVPHKRIDLLLRQIVDASKRIPSLHVDVVGDGPALPALRRLAADLELSDVVAFHGWQPNEVRDSLLRRAWLTTSTSIGEGWGCSVLEAAAWGVPCAALNVTGIRDAVIDGQTGWLVEDPQKFGSALADFLARLAAEELAAKMAAQCRQWAQCFTWEHSAELLAGVVQSEIDASLTRRTAVGERRTARPDIATVLAGQDISTSDARKTLRATDQISSVNGSVRLLLCGCDDFDAALVIRRLGGHARNIRIADRYDLLVGPHRLPMLSASLPGQAPEDWA